MQQSTAISPSATNHTLAIKGDLAEIKRDGRLRVLTETQDVSAKSSNPIEASLISQYAREQNLALEWIAAEKSELISQLREGKGDLVLSVLNAEQKDDLAQIQLTQPWGVSQQQVITRTDTGRIRSIDDLKTRQVAIKRSSPVWTQLHNLQKQNPAMDLIIIPELAKTEHVLQKVTSGQYDVTILDNLLAEHYLPRFLNLEVALNVNEVKTVSWAVRSVSMELHDSLNSFLTRQYLQADLVRTYQEDLPGLQGKRLLRLITLQSPVNYFLHDGKLRGFEHDLLKRFSESQQMRLDVVIADSHEEMQQLLLSGKGDVIGASLPRNSFSNNLQVAFSRTYSHAAPVIIGRSKDTPILDIRGLKGRRLVLPAASPYQGLVERIKASGVDLEIIKAEAGESTENILFRVAKGVYDLTLLGGLELNAQLNHQVNLRAHFALSEPLPHAWAVRKSDTQLLSALNEFIEKEFRKGLQRPLYEIY